MLLLRLYDKWQKPYHYASEIYVSNKSKYISQAEFVFDVNLLYLHTSPSTVYFDSGLVFIIRENVHQVGSILFQTNFINTQLAMFYLLLRFDHHRRPTSGTECLVVTAP